MKRKTDNERGASLVEFALILPVFMALILGTFTGGLAYNRKITITDAVREGARYGATLSGGVADKATWKSAVEARVLQLSAGELTAGQICADLVPANTPSACPSPPPLQAERTVHVRAARTSRLEVLLFSTNLTLQSSSFARYEREPTS